MSTEIIATADFKLSGAGWDGLPVNYEVHASLFKSGAFEYGNGTGMAFEWNNGNRETFDTRYNRVNAENFTQFAYEVLRSRTMETINVEVVK